MHNGVTSHLWLKSALQRVIPSMHVHLCVASWLFSPRLSCPLLRPTVLLPALPDVYLRVQREVQVQPLCDFRLGTVVTSDYETPLTLYSPREESFTIPLKNIDVTRTTHTNLDVKLEKRIDDYWNIDGSRDLSDPWTGFTDNLLYSMKKLLTDILGPGGD